MANRRPPWKIPDVIDPPNRRCIKIEVPDDPQHIQILWGVLRGLSDWQRWEQEPSHKATLVAQVWRKVVYAIDWSIMSCCPEVTNSYYDENGILQVSYDGGLTYEPAPSDPRFSAPLAPPLTSTEGDTRRCEAANNVVGYMKSTADQLIADALLWGEISGMIGAIIAIIFVLLEIGSGGALTPLLLALSAALLGTGQAAFDAAMTTDVYDSLLCIVYCHTPDNGSYTAANWQQIKAEIAAQITGIAEKFLYDTVNAMGLAGMTNASRTGLSYGGDCDSCVCSNLCADKYHIWNGIGGAAPAGTYGTILERDGDRIRVQFNGNYITLEVDVSGNCCVADHWELVSGGAAYSTAYNECGTPFTGTAFQHGVAWEGQCVELLEMQALGEDRPVVDIFFSAECT